MNISDQFKEVKEVKEVKAAPKKKAPLKKVKRGLSAWEKRKGKGTTKSWKKTPGGVKKKFKFSK